MSSHNGKLNSICVFSSSSDDVDPVFFKAAEELGRLIAEKHYTLVYGGAKIGLMGAVAKAAHRHGGKVIGVIPKSMTAKEVLYELADEIILTKDMRDRKTIMEERSDIFIGLPGGFGTLEEILEMLTLKQLHYHAKPIVLLNTNGYYDGLIDFFEQIYTQKFAKERHRKNYHIAPDHQSVFSYIESYRNTSK